MLAENFFDIFNFKIHSGMKNFIVREILIIPHLPIIRQKLMVS